MHQVVSKHHLILTMTLGCFILRPHFTAEQKYSDLLTDAEDQQLMSVI